MPAWCSSATAIRQLTVGLLCTLAVVSAVAQTLSDRSSPFGGSSFLPVDEAFRFHTSIDSAEQLSVHWQIAAGYYLYQDKFRFSMLTGDAGEAQILELEHALPEGVAHHDEFFGDVTVYYSEVAASVVLPADSPQQFILLVEFQGCAEAGLCYLPETRRVEIFR